jgi:hypothetical protein
LTARIVGVSVWGPGLEGWRASQPVLAGTVDHAPAASPAPPPAILPANERRRTGPVARLALTVAGEAAAMSGLPAGDLRSVFASGNGDGIVVGSILTDLTGPGDQARLLSPTQFHNSVHNAAAGYWSIATSCRQPVTCLACHDFTWPASLLAAMAEVTMHGEPVLLCVYDHPMPAPLDAKRGLLAPFGVGLVLAPVGQGPVGQLGGMAGITVQFAPDPAPGDAAMPSQPALRALAAGNPAAHALRLLETLARGVQDQHALAYLDGRLDVTVTP